jgi:hypothetical protein
MIVVPITTCRLAPCFRLLCSASHNRSCTVDNFLSQTFQMNSFKPHPIRGISRYAPMVTIQLRHLPFYNDKRLDLQALGVTDDSRTYHDP